MKSLDLARVLESIPQIVWTTRPDGTIDDYNRRWSEYTGLPPAGGDAQVWEAVIHPDDLSELRARWAKALSERAPFEMEYRLRDASGHYQWHLGRSQVIADEQGAVIGWFGTATNIDAQIRATESLRIARAEAEAQKQSLRELFLQAPAIINVQRGPDHVFELVHPLTIKLLGRDVTGMSVREAMPELEGQALIAHLDEVYRTGVPFHADAFHVRLDRGRGSLEDCYFDFVYQPLRGSGGAIEGVLTFAFEVTDQVSALRAAEASAQRLLLLSRIGGTLADSLDYQTTIGNVVRLVVPDFADACTLELLTDPATLSTTQVAAAHVDESKTELLRQFRREFPVDPREPHGTGEVLRTGAPELYTDIPDSLIDQTARSARYAELLRAIGLRSSITVPLTARGRAIGTLSLVLGTSGRRYVQADVDFAREIAHRAAMAIDQARLFGELGAEKERLLLAERRFRTLAEATSQIVWTTHPDGKPLEDSPSWRAFTGQSDEEWISGRGWSAVHPDDEPAMRAAWPAAREGHAPFELEFRLRRHDGVYVPMIARAVPVLNEDGSVREWVGTSVDVTAKKQAETRQRVLAEASEALASSFDRSSSGVLVSIVARAIGDACVLTLVDDDRRTLRTIAAAHRRPEATSLMQQVEQTVVPPGPLPTLAFRENRAVRRNDVDVDEMIANATSPITAEYYRTFGVSAVLVAPLCVEGVVIGTLGVSRDRGGAPYTDDDQSLLEELANRASILIHNARLYDEAERTRRSLSTMLQSIGDALIATDAAGRVTFINPVAEALTGWSAQDAVGQPIDEVFRIVHEGTRASVESPVTRVVREGVVVGLANHTVLVAKGGAAETPIDDSGAPIRDERGNLTGVVLVFRDVSERKKSDDRRTFLAQASNELSSSLDYAATLAKVARLSVPTLADWCSIEIVEEGQTASKQLAVAHVDPAKVAMAAEFGERYPPDPNAPSGVPNVLRTGKSELWPEIPEELLRAAAVDDEHLRLILELRLQSAMVVPLIARGRTLGAITFIHAESGRRYASDDLAFAEDLARRAAIAVDNARLYEEAITAKTKIEEALRARENFISMASHELRTPITGLSLQLQTMLRMAKKNVDVERLTPKVEIAQRQLGRLTVLTNDLLDVSRLSAGRLQLDLQDLDASTLVAEIVARFQEELTELGCAVTLAVDPTVVLRADRARMDQVITNLLTNAMKYGRAKPIEIRLRAVGDRGVLSVRDHGMGIPRASQQLIFEQFERAAGAKAIGGFGLGLWIVRNVLELMGGTIAVESVVNEGSVFTVTLPLVTEKGSVE